MHEHLDQPAGQRGRAASRSGARRTEGGEGLGGLRAPLGPHPALVVPVEVEPGRGEPAHEPPPGLLRGLELVGEHVVDVPAHRTGRASPTAPESGRPGRRRGHGARRARRPRCRTSSRVGRPAPDDGTHRRWQNKRVSDNLRVVTTTTVDAWSALGDPTRRGIFARLVERPQSVTELARGPPGQPAGRLAAPPGAQGGQPGPGAAGRSPPHLPAHPQGLARLRSELDAFWGATLDNFKQLAEQEQADDREH